MTSPQRLSRMSKKRRANAVVAKAKDNVDVGVVERLGYAPITVAVVAKEKVMAYWYDWAAFKRLLSSTPAARNTPRQE